MTGQIEFEIGDWKPLTKSPWDKKGYILIQNVDIFGLTDEILHNQDIPAGTSQSILASYTSYITQVIKDIDYTAQALREGDEQTVSDIITFSVDAPITMRQPWRYTGRVIKYLVNECNLGEIVKGDPAHLFSQIEPLIFKALEDEALMTVKKYVPTAQVLLDHAYEAGWHQKFARPADVRKREGVVQSVSRGLELREVALVLAKSLYIRGYRKGTVKALQLGFVDIIQVISSLTDEEIDSLLTLSHKECMHALLETANQFHNTGTYNNIVSGVMRLLQVNEPDAESAASV